MATPIIPNNILNRRLYGFGGSNSVVPPSPQAYYYLQSLSDLVVTRGIGPVTFTRNSTQVVTNNEGKLQSIVANQPAFPGLRAVTNNIPTSTDLTQINSGLIPVAGSVDPLGGATAYRVTAVSNGDAWYKAFNNTVIGNVYRNSIWIKRITGTGQLQMYTDAGGVVNITATSSWQRIATPALTATLVNNYWGIKFLVGGDAVDVWHPQQDIVTGLTNQNPGEYVPTTTAATTQWFNYANPNTVDGSGVVTDSGVRTPVYTSQGLFTEPAGTNLLLQSQTLGTTWLLAGTASLTGSDQLNLPAVSDYIYQTVTATIAASVYTYSIWATGNGTCNLSSPAGDTPITLTAVPTRFSVTFTASGASTVFIVRRAGNTATIVSNIKAQLETGPFATSPILTSTTSATRIATVASNPIADMPNYGAVTNLLLQSQTFGTTWTISNATVGTKVLAPDGTTTADEIYETAVNAQHNAVQGIGKASSAITYTTSIYAKPNGRSWFVMTPFDGTNGDRYWFNLSGAGSVGTHVVIGTGFTGVSASITLDKNGYYRCCVTYTTTATPTISNYLYPATADNVVSYLGDITKGIILWGAQLNTGSTALPYIATNTTSVTAYPAIPPESIKLLVTPSVTPSGVLATEQVLWSSYTDANNELSIRWSGTTLTFRKRVAGSNNDATIAAALVSGTTYTVTGNIYSDNSINIFLNGTAGTASANTTAPVLGTTFQVGSSNGLLQFLGNIKDVSIYKRILPGG